MIKHWILFLGTENFTTNETSQYSPSYTKIHVDKDTGPDFCVTAIGK